MAVSRPFALVRTADQWRRCAYESTFLDTVRGVVSLAWVPGESGGASPPPALEAGGLAFDNAARLYRSLPDEGRIEWFPPATTVPGGVAPPSPAALDLFGGEPPATTGDFAAGSPAGSGSASRRGRSARGIDRAPRPGRGGGRTGWRGRPAPTPGGSARGSTAP